MGQVPGEAWSAGALGASDDRRLPPPIPRHRLRATLLLGAWGQGGHAQMFWGEAALVCLAAWSALEVAHPGPILLLPRLLARTALAAIFVRPADSPVPPPLSCR